MLRELTGDDWLDILGLTTEFVPEVLWLRGTRNLRTRYLDHVALMSDVVEVGSPNGLFEDVAIGLIDGVRVAYASVYGPAMASEITHVFGRIGTGIVIQTGVCGALADDIGPGELVIATEAGCGEGAVSCYLPGRISIEASADLVEWAMDWELGGATRHAGPIWTTAALLAEGNEEIERWRQLGFLAVDMETATTFGVAEWTGMRRVSILSVFDNPRLGAHIALTEHDKAEARAAGEAAMRRLTLDLIRAHAG